MLHVVDRQHRVVQANRHRRQAEFIEPWWAHAFETPAHVIRKKPRRAALKRRQIGPPSGRPGVQTRLQLVKAAGLVNGDLKELKRIGREERVAAKFRVAQRTVE
jgi:hypothetical protein